MALVSWFRSLWRPGNRKALACIATTLLLTAYAVRSGASFDSYAEHVIYVLGIFVTGHVAQRSRLAQENATVAEDKAQVST